MKENKIVYQLLPLIVVLFAVATVRAEDTDPNYWQDRFTLEPEFSMDSGDYGGGDVIATYEFSITGEYEITRAWTLSLTIVPYLHQDETYTDVVLVAGKPVHHFDTSGAHPHHRDTHVHSGHAPGLGGHDSGHLDSHGTSHHDSYNPVHSDVHQQSDHYVQSGGSRNVDAASGYTPFSGQGFESQVVAGKPVEEEVRRHGSATGIGDTLVDLAYRVLEETEITPELSIHTGLKIPTADEDKGLGTGQLDYQAGVEVSKEFSGWSADSGIDYTVLGEPDEYDLENYISGYVEVATMITPTLEFALDFSGAQASSEESDAELALGMEFRYDLQGAGTFSAGLGKGLADGSPDYSMVIGYSISF